MIIASRRPTGHRDFDWEVMNDIKIIDAGPEGSVEFELYLDEKYSNLNGCVLTIGCNYKVSNSSTDVMHGGAAAVIFGMLDDALVFKSKD
jgi:acyl-coenzyme A thioesterase 13